MKLKHFNDSVLKVNQTLSTNDLMWELLATKPYGNGFTVVAQAQTKGKGQTGNEWVAEPGKNLTCSLAFKPNLSSQKLFYLNMLVALAIKKTLADFNLDAVIKWPNDILVDGKKIAGILIENQIQGRIISQTVVGIGLNINQTNFELNRPITSMAIELGKEMSPEKIFSTLYKQVDAFYDLLENQHFHTLKKLYTNQLYRMDTWAEYAADNLGRFTGKIIDIDDSGKLVVDTIDRTQYKFDLQTIRFL